MRKNTSLKYLSSLNPERATTEELLKVCIETLKDKIIFKEV
jgi:hypothetical protein